MTVRGALESSARRAWGEVRAAVRCRTRRKRETGRERVGKEGEKRGRNMFSG